MPFFFAASNVAAAEASSFSGKIVSPSLRKFPFDDIGATLISCSMPDDGYQSRSKSTGAWVWSQKVVMNWTSVSPRRLAAPPNIVFAGNHRTLEAPSANLSRPRRRRKPAGADFFAYPRADCGGDFAPGFAGAIVADSRRAAQGIQEFGNLRLRAAHQRRLPGRQADGRHLRC